MGGLPKQVFKGEVSIGEGWQGVAAGDIVHVGTQHAGFVTFWYETDSMRQQALIVVPTGGEVEWDAEHVGTTIDDGGFVWHLYRRHGD